MGKIEDAILDRIDAWPEEAKAELMQSIVEIEKKHFGVYRLTDDERAAVRRGLEEARQRKFATEDRIAEIFGQYRS